MIEEIVIDNGLRNEKLNVPKRKKVKVPEDLFELPTIAAFIGHKGSGKTNAACLLAKKYQEFGSINTIYVISPTFKSNPEFEVLNISPENVYDDINGVVQAITEIEQKVIEEVNEYKEFLKYKKSYQNWLKGKASLFDITVLEQNDYKKPPNYEYPKPLIIMDDLSHSPIYSVSSNNPFNNLALRHRHIGGRGFGVSIFMMVQTFKTGIPRALRQGAVQQFFVWKTNDNTNLQQMYEEMANACTYPQFLQMYQIATREPHNFLTVDPYDSNESKRFRKNFDTFLLPSSDHK